MSDTTTPTDQLVASYDRDLSRYVLTGWLSGPAGTAALELADGRVVIDVDYAAPGTISHIEVDATDRALVHDVSRSLALVTGVPDLGRRLESVDETPRVIWTRGADTEDSQRDDVGRLALLLSEYDNARRSALARAAAALEAASLIGDLDPRLRVDHQPAVLWRVVVNLLGTMPRSPAQFRAPLGLAAERAAPVDPLLSRQLDRLALAAEPKEYFAAAEAMTLTAPSAPPAPMAKRAARSARRERPDVNVEIAPDFDLALSTATLADGVLRVGVTGARSAHTPLYLRVFDGWSRPVPLAIVPFAPTRFDSASATAVVPRKVDRRKLAVEVTDQPDTPLMTPSIRNLMRAVRIGRDASRHTRRGDTEAAAEWQRDAAAWSAIGDDRRANLARSYASAGSVRSGRRPSAEPLLSDLVD